MRLQRVLMFSGGDYAEVAWWLSLFTTSHAKRESPRVEAEVERDDERQSTYTVRLTYGERRSPPLVLGAAEVASERGSLGWCSRLASRIRALAHELVQPPEAGNRVAS